MNVAFGEAESKYLLVCKRLWHDLLRNERRSGWGFVPGPANSMALGELGVRRLQHSFMFRTFKSTREDNILLVCNRHQSFKPAFAFGLLHMFSAFVDPDIGN